MSTNVKQNKDDYTDYMLDLTFKHLMVMHKDYFAYILNFILPEISIEKILKGKFLNSELMINNFHNKGKRVDVLYQIDNI